VPKDRIFMVIDDLLWNAILGTNAYPRMLWEQLKSELCGHIDDDDECEAAVEQRLEMMRNPPGGPWQHLFIHDHNAVVATVLLRCPIEPCWVVESQ